jgi:hypothetical protein
MRFPLPAFDRGLLLAAVGIGVGLLVASGCASEPAAGEPAGELQHPPGWEQVADVTVDGDRTKVFRFCDGVYRVYLTYGHVESSVAAARDGHCPQR